MSKSLENQALLALISDTRKDQLKETLKDHLDDALFCTRVWEAWSVNTMSQDDFTGVADDEEFIEELANAILLKILNMEP